MYFIKPFYQLYNQLIIYIFTSSYSLYIDKKMNAIYFIYLALLVKYIDNKNGD